MQPGDLPALLQLYGAVVPPAMRHAEGSLRDGNGLSHLDALCVRQAADLVWEEGGVALAHLRLCSGARGLWLDAVVHPDHQADAIACLRHVLSLAQASASRPVYCTVPDHAVGLGWVVRALGLASFARQVLLVAHTMARAPVRRPIGVTGLESGIESAQRCAQIETAPELPPITPARGHKEVVCH
ncbi:MAG: hypothetical protein V1772_11760 [Chloroflexota bacterium]